jgi:hypothetical protein
MRCRKLSDHGMRLAGPDPMMVTARVLRRRLAADEVKDRGCARGQTESSCPGDDGPLLDNCAP